MQYCHDQSTNTKHGLTPNRQAAMYVRMSTDHQKYSIDNQEKSIRDYADRHNITIISVYTDRGKSGLGVEGRDALQRLISDVESGSASFSIILVLDVTRWGRFQDADESAYYEYRCRQAGIDVQYVAEQFENDGSTGSTIVKSVKRAMAGEYSRELSGKVFAGQCRLIENGFRQGGPAGFGLRRMLIDELGNEKGLLNPGEYKSLQTDRVILVPGPDDEVAVVQSIYDYFVNDHMSEREIADRLNAKGITTDLNRPWNRGTIHQILTNEKYIGNNVFNRTSFKLKKRRVKNSPDMWVRLEGAFNPIVLAKDYYMAAGIIAERNRKLSDETLLSKLDELHKSKGWLSGLLIDEMDDMPSSSAYRTRFGSLIRAYKLIGYTPDRDYRYIEVNQRLREMHPDIVERITKSILKVGGAASDPEDGGMILINNEISISVVLSRCFQTPAGSNRWKIRLDRGMRPDITVALRMDEENREVLDYYLLPSLDMNTSRLKLADANVFNLDAYRFDTLDYFFKLVKRVGLREVA